jgi:hypothetical protein
MGQSGGAMLAATLMMLLIGLAADLATIVVFGVRQIH